MSGELLRFHAISIARKSEAPEGARCSNRSLIGGHIGEHSQGSVVLVVESDEAEGLQGSIRFRHRSQHFSHAMDGGGLRLEGQFHKVSGRKWRVHLQQPAGHRNDLQFAIGMLATFLHDDGSHWLRHLNARGPATRVGLGEVRHRLNDFTRATDSHDYESGWPDSSFPIVNGRGKARRTIVYRIPKMQVTALEDVINQSRRFRILPRNGCGERLPAGRPTGR